MSELTPEELAEYAADVKQTQAAQAENILSKITRLTREAKEAAVDVEAAQANLKRAYDRWRNLTEFQLPEAFSEAQQTKLTTADGQPVEVEEQLHASIPKANLPKAVMWLSANGQGALVKRKIELAFGKEDDQKAAEALDTLLEAGFTPTDTQSVHPQSLAAAIREMLKDGKEVPMTLLGAHVRRVAKIKGVKVKKTEGS